MACLIKREIIRLTIVSTAAGVILFNQNLSLNTVGAGSILDFNAQGLGGSEQITQLGLVETINYYTGLASKKEYVGFENSIITPDSEADGQDTQTNDQALVIVNNNAVFGSARFGDTDNGVNSAAPRKEIITYQIKPGDTPSSIADYFGISTNTLLWANNLTLADATRIKIGDKLTILPVNGVHHAVKKGDTLASIAKKYSADKARIVAFNGLNEEEALEIDRILVVPDGKKPAPPTPVIPRGVSSSTSGTIANKAGAKGVYRYVTNDQYNNPNTDAGDTHPPAHGRLYPWGQCTYYVALRRYVPWNGNANMWLRNAKAYGFKTGSEPRVGAIVATSENPRYGHVAYVEAVSDGKITISEMNYVGLGIKSVRVLSTSSPVIRGYIYDSN